MKYRDLLRHMVIFALICLGTSILDVVVSSVRSQPPLPNLRDLWTDPIWWFGLVFTYYIMTRMAQQRNTQSDEVSEQT